MPGTLVGIGGDFSRRFTRSVSPGCHVHAGSGTISVPWRRFVATGDSFTEGLWDVPRRPPDRDHVHRPGAPRAGAGPTCSPGTWPTGRTRPDAEVRQPRSPGPPARADRARAAAGRAGRTRPGQRRRRRQRPAPSRRRPGRARRPSRTPSRGFRATGADVLMATGMDTKDSPLVRRTEGAPGCSTPTSGPSPGATARTSSTCGGCARCATGGCGRRTGST